MADEPRAAGRRWSFPIGRIAGIEIRVHASFFVLVALFVAAGLAPRGPGVLSALTWLVLVFASVVFHELAHSIVGRRRGAVVREIDLLPIGGMSRLERLPETPSDEFAMAIAGPASSAALGLGAAAIALATSAPLWPVDFVGGPLLPRFAAVNLLLAAFNMLPAFPLDGGRVFRALLERRYDLARATHIAATTGRWFAFALIAVGMLVDPWLAVIGVFVYVGAAGEERATLVHLQLVGHRVGDVMLHSPRVVECDTRMRDLQVLLHDPQRVFPVVRGGHLAGLIDVSTIRMAPPEAHAAEVLAAGPTSVTPSADLEGSLEALQGSDAGALAVVDGDQLVGLLRVEDVQQLALGAAPA